MADLAAGSEHLLEQVCELLLGAEPLEALLALAAVLSAVMYEIPAELRVASLPRIIAMLEEPPAPTGVH